MGGIAAGIGVLEVKGQILVELSFEDSIEVAAATHVCVLCPQITAMTVSMYLYCHLDKRVS